MNKEIIKAMQGKKEHKARKWWRKNGYKVLRITLFPMWISTILANKGRAWLNSQQEWDEERATEILNYYIPRCAKWDEENQCFYFFDNGCGWNLAYAKKFLKRKDRRFWRVNCGKMRTLLMEKFELEGFTKEIGNCSDGWTEITYYLNK